MKEQEHWTGGATLRSLTTAAKRGCQVQKEFSSWGSCDCTDGHPKPLAFIDFAHSSPSPKCSGWRTSRVVSKPLGVVAFLPQGVSENSIDWLPAIPHHP